MAESGGPTEPVDPEDAVFPAHSEVSLAVEAAVGASWSTGRILRMLTDPSGPYRLSERTAERRVAKARKAVREFAEELRPVRKAQIENKLLETHRCAMEAEQYAAALGCLKEIKSLWGLDEPQEFRDRTEKVVDLSKLTDDELATHVRLMRKASGEPAPEE